MLFFSFLYFSSFLQNPFCARGVRTGVCVLKRVFFFRFSFSTKPRPVAAFAAVSSSNTHTTSRRCLHATSTYTARAIQRLLSQAVVERDAAVLWPRARRGKTRKLFLWSNTTQQKKTKGTRKRRGQNPKTGLNRLRDDDGLQYRGKRTHTNIHTASAQMIFGVCDVVELFFATRPLTTVGRSDRSNGGWVGGRRRVSWLMVFFFAVVALAFDCLS